LRKRAEKRPGEQHNLIDSPLQQNPSTGVGVLASLQPLTSLPPGSKVFRNILQGLETILGTAEGFDRISSPEAGKG